MLSIARSAAVAKSGLEEPEHSCAAPPRARDFCLRTNGLRKEHGMKVDLDSTVRQNPDQDAVSADLDDQVVMLSLERGSYYHLDELGAHIWKLIEQPIRVGALCDRLMETFEVGREECERDVLAFLHDLAADRLVEVSGRTGS
jgi:hypothetical protein